MSFAYARPESWESAAALLQDATSQPLGGGTDLIPLIREHQQSPTRVVDLRGIAEARRIVRMDDGSVTIGAAVTLRELALDVTLRESFPALSEACHAVGSYALRAMGTLGGNLCQHVRCWYFRQGHECLRLGGTHCSAQRGENQYHAVFQQGPCVAVHPSDPAVALHALEAQVHVQRASGARTVPMAEFLAPSRERLDATTVLAPGEFVTAVTIPAHSSGGVQLYEKSMQRGAWDFALVSLAALRRPDGEVRLVLGGVANTPWRVTDSIEEDLASGGLAAEDIETLAQRALYDATPLAGNAYKLDIAAALLRRAMGRLVTS
ncbi:MAG: xanthine dehydrogenase family protein subunit M [Cytophagaceae bacterium]|nr:xanthine dehydrogenase family protein subunit M [Gemmatimonadaceae bacterium]